MIESMWHRENLYGVSRVYTSYVRDILTKIGSGRDWDRGGLPDFLTNRDRGGEGNPTRPEIWDMSGCPIPSIPQFFPAFLGQKKIEKNWGKSGKIKGNQEKSREIRKNQGKSGNIKGNWEKSRKIGENQGKSRLFPTYLKLFKKDWDGHLDSSQLLGKNWDGHLDLSRRCRPRST